MRRLLNPISEAPVAAAPAEVENPVEFVADTAVETAGRRLH